MESRSKIRLVVILNTANSSTVPLGRVTGTEGRVA
jgi:hypothetical protein